MRPAYGEAGRRHYLRGHIGPEEGPACEAVPLPYRQLIIRAFAKNGKVDVDGILSQTPYQGISGSIEMDAKTRDLKSTLIPATLDKEGKIIPLEE